MARKADPDKKDNIIRAAVRVFALKGYAATRIIDVARAAGIGKGTIYDYFKSKEDLFFAVFQQVTQEAQTPVLAALTAHHGSVSAKLKAMAESLVLFWLDKIELYALTMEFWSATTVHVGRERFKAAFQTAYETFRQELAALIREGVSKGEFSPECHPYEVSSGLIGMLDALVLQAWLDSNFDALKTARACLDSLLRGLEAPTK